ncbi:hypothetical protein KYJ26_13410 [Bacillus sp. MCCB 382]|uniref:hypothetical protein n=1 Tax=Bacillus sp. MCCB 382 TaxID=2860197 RepID=UPI001C57CE21|nr:hypothetical protein [Bacillus sp. MCCB 382]
MSDYSVANLSDDMLDKVKSMESELRRQTADDIVLIAYKNTEISPEGEGQNG